LKSNILPPYIILYNNQEIKGKFAILVVFLRQSAQTTTYGIVQNAVKRYKVKKSEKNFEKRVDKWV
jgi:hypothetical protein